MHVFFFLSGFLITQSALRYETRPFKYVWARARRIFPALWVHAVIIPPALVLVGAWQDVSVSELIGYSLSVAGLVMVEFTHAGAFGDNPFPEAINGSLWSLRYELIVFGLLGLAGISGALKHRIGLAVFCRGLAGQVHD